MLAAIELLEDAMEHLPPNSPETMRIFMQIEKLKEQHELQQQQHQANGSSSSSTQDTGVPIDNTVSPGTVTGVAVATAGSSRTNERTHSVNATTTNSFPPIDVFFNNRQNNNERTTTNDEGEHEEVVDNLRSRQCVPQLQLLPRPTAGDSASTAGDSATTVVTKRKSKTVLERNRESQRSYRKRKKLSFESLTNQVHQLQTQLRTAEATIARLKDNSGNTDTTDGGVGALEQEKKEVDPKNANADNNETTTTTTTNNRSSNNANEEATAGPAETDDDDNGNSILTHSLEQQQLQQQHSRYTTIHVRVPHEPLLPGNRMVIDLPANQEDEEGTVLFEITVPSNIEPGTIIPVQVPTQQPPTAITELEKIFIVKRYNLSYKYWGMLFSYYNKKYNPKFLYGTDFDESEFPIRLTDERVLDRFTQWVLDATHDQLTGLPFEGKLGGCVCVDHRHGVPKDGRIAIRSQDGTFRCLCSASINIAIGVFENVIVANSNPDVGGTDAITPPYDATNDKNATFLRDVHDLLTVTTPKLREEWIRDPLAKTVRDEVLLRNEKLSIMRNKKTTKFLSGEWSKVEDENLVKGISEKGWSNWTLISAYHVQTRSSNQVCKRAHYLLKKNCEETS